MAKNTDDTWVQGTGRRKTAIARVRMRAGTGKIVVNKKGLEDYFPTSREYGVVRSPLKAVELESSVDVVVTTAGGGYAAQAGAISLGLARALVRRNPEHEPVLRDGKFLTRDARQKERKKYGKAAARKSFQFSKR